MGLKKGTKLRRFSEKEKEAVARTVRERPDLTYEEVAEIHGMKWRTARQIAVARGAPPRLVALDAATVGKLKRYKQLGYTLHRIAQMTGISIFRIKKTLSRHKYTKVQYQKEVKQKAQEAIELIEREKLTKAVAANRVGLTYNQLSGYICRMAQRVKMESFLQQETESADHKQQRDNTTDTEHLHEDLGEQSDPREPDQEARPSRSPLGPKLQRP